LGNQNILEAAERRRLVETRLDGSEYNPWVRAHSTIQDFIGSNCILETHDGGNVENIYEIFKVQPYGLTFLEVSTVVLFADQILSSGVEHA